MWQNLLSLINLSVPHAFAMGEEEQTKASRVPAAAVPAEVLEIILSKACMRQLHKDKTLFNDACPMSVCQEWRDILKMPSVRRTLKKEGYVKEMKMRLALMKEKELSSEWARLQKQLTVK